MKRSQLRQRAVVVRHVLDSRSISPFLRLEADRLTVAYTGGASHSFDAATIAAHVRLADAVYFEATCLQGSR